MDEQFGGRTDDDLFADEYEPVDEEEQVVAEPAQAQRLETDGSREPAAAEEAAATHTQPTPPSETQQTTLPIPKPTGSLPSTRQAAPKSLAQSRHNKPAPSSRPPRQQRAPPAATTSPVSPATTTDAPVPQTAETPADASTASDNAPNPAPRTAANGPVKADPQVRLRSGANPRTKLTDDELAAKMEKMRILSAEKTKRFEREQRDETEHAVAYAKGMEEARRRRALEEEKRRRGEEERRRMDDERAKNRERKLAAMGQKEGGWDEGKDALDDVEERKVFRGANGGVRGARSGGGLSGSRFASAPAEEQVDNRRDFGERRDHGERGGRGRGRGRGGRGGRGLFEGERDGHDRNQFHANKDNGPGSSFNRTPAAPPPPKVEDFPALPVSTARKEPPTKVPLPSLDDLSKPFSPLSPALGGGAWDDEMAALEAKRDGEA